MFKWFKKEKAEDSKSVTKYHLLIECKDSKDESFTSSNDIYPVEFEELLDWYHKRKAETYLMTFNQGTLSLLRSNVVSIKIWKE